MVHEERIGVGRAYEIMTLDHVLPAVHGEPVPGKARLRAREDRQLQTSPAAAKTAAQAAGLAAIDQVCRLSAKARCDPPNKTCQGLPPLPVPSPRAHSSSSSINSSHIKALLRMSNPATMCPTAP